MNNELLSIAAAARRSGLTEWRIRAAIRAGDLSAFKVGTGADREHLRVTPDALAQWMKSLKVGSRA